MEQSKFWILYTLSLPEPSATTVYKYSLSSPTLMESSTISEENDETKKKEP